MFLISTPSPCNSLVLCDQTAIYLTSQNPHLALCFLLPTSLLYSLVFISPTIFHHIILILTLYKSIIHLRTTRAGGIKSIMNIVQRDHILFVLAICLINFANLVLVLQRRDWPYRLVSCVYFFLSLSYFPLSPLSSFFSCSFCLLSSVFTPRLVSSSHHLSIHWQLCRTETFS